MDEAGGVVSFGDYGAEFCKYGYLHGSIENLVFSAELDHLLLGLLDGLVRCSSIFYRTDFKRKKYTTDNFGWVRIWSRINRGKFYCSWQLLNGNADERNSGFYHSPETLFHLCP